MKVDRRRALAMLGVGAAGPAHAAQRRGREPAARFQHGVASGDPTDNGAILWTRVTPASDGPLEVFLQLSTEPRFRRVLRETVARTGPDRDYTVKSDISALKPGTEYFYRFRAGGAVSPVGRFRTLPERADDVVLAVVSCALHPGGLFNAYDAVAKLPRVDAVIHLGDYIYEYGAADSDYGVRTGKALNRLPQPPREIVTLADYRLRHAQYKADPDLQAAHARAAWITVWDDHETANDAWLGGAENHDPDRNEGAWAERKANALKAYYEWMPIREPGPGRSREMINRTFRFGNIASLHMTETRLTARSEQLSYERDLAMTSAGPDLQGFRAKLNAPDRRLMGDGQLADLARSIGESVRSGVTWQLLGNQVVMGRVRGPNVIAAVGPEKSAAMFGAIDPAIRSRVETMAKLFVNDLPFNLDSWDGYPAERERLYGVFKAAGARPIVLAGDSHAFWVNDLKDASGARVGAEFGTTAVTSPGFGDIIQAFDLGALLAQQNDEVVFSDQAAKGFTLLRLTSTEAVGELVAVSTVLTKPYTTRTVGRFRVRPADRGIAGVERI